MARLDRAISLNAMKKVMGREARSMTKGAVERLFSVGEYKTSVLLA